ncbi:MAG TPA: CpsD/CapB family tyrosine-protein kinase [Candidatus Sulfotelmatobacter sp.]|nr:CpsD/CapB family tyrosine-protein kinase [Candidatus Sulfotelmatobacter sp.]
MSRIHEALKKAEQERATAQGGGPAGFAAAPVAEAPAYEELDAAHVASNVGMPDLGGPFSLETLLSRCPLTPWNPDLQTMLFMNGNDSAKGTEEYRTLRSRLYHIRERMPLKKLLVTSALPKEGKSFTSANLAQVLVRQHGRRALLIDADLRGPRLHQMLGTPQGPGLAEYLLGKADEASVIQRGPMEGFFFIPSGESIEDPAELVASGRLKILLQRVEPLFDWIIVDSPPAIPVSDASVLAKVCDGVLMVVRSASTPSDVARKARMEFPDQMLVGVVLNGTERDEAQYARYYYETYEKKISPTQS